MARRSREAGEAQCPQRGSKSEVFLPARQVRCTLHERTSPGPGRSSFYRSCLKCHPYPAQLAQCLGLLQSVFVSEQLPSRAATRDIIPIEEPGFPAIWKANSSSRNRYGFVFYDADMVSHRGGRRHSHWLGQSEAPARCCYRRHSVRVLLPRANVLRFGARRENRPLDRQTLRSLTEPESW
jgi:hypothetical protein